MRKFPLVNGSIYHVFTKSIADYKVFRSIKDYKRMKEVIRFYRYERPPTKFSIYLTLKNKDKFFLKYLSEREKIVEIIAYCLMPTHLHLMITQLKDNGISFFMKNILDSYTRYFNIKNKRKGPLWQGRFKSVLLESNEQLYHLTRYIHLNPTTEGLVKRPEEWQYSSYNEYLNLNRDDEKICNYTKYLDIKPEEYRKFVESRMEYQKDLKKIKHLILE